MCPFERGSGELALLAHQLDVLMKHFSKARTGLIPFAENEKSERMRKKASAAPTSVFVHFRREDGGEEAVI